MKKIPLVRPILPDKDEFLECISSVWETHTLTNQGPLVQKFEKELSVFLKTEQVSVFVNGHIALESALRSLGLEEGEVITTPFTFVSTAQAITACGLTPVFCDIKRKDCTIDEGKIEALITSKTRAIVPVHVYGFPCNYKEIQQIAEKYNLRVVYDAAHAFGVIVDGQGIGSIGEATMFSFHATKLFHSVEGGAICYSGNKMRKRISAIRNFGLTECGDVEEFGYNGKMGEFSGAMGLCNLNKMGSIIEKRQELVEYYLKKLSSLEGLSLFSWESKTVSYNYAYFPILIAETACLSAQEVEKLLLKEYGIMTRRYFSPLVSDFMRFREQFNSNETPIAKNIAERVLTLPLFVGLTFDEIDYICESLSMLLGKTLGDC